MAQDDRSGRRTSTSRPTVRIPAAIHAALSDLNPQLEARPEPGQMWRLEFSGAVCLGYLADVTSTDVRVLVVGEDTQYADKRTEIVPAVQSPLGFPLGIWTDLHRRFPRYVLDRKLGELDTRLQAHEATDEPVSAVDPRRRYRLRLREQLDALQEAVEEVDQPSDEEALGSLLRRQNVDPSDVREALDTRRALRAFQGQLYLPPNDPAVEKLAALAGLPVSAVRSALPNPPAKLWIRLHQPRWRSSVRQWGSDQDLSEVAARWRVAEEVGAGSFRRAGAVAAEPDWEQALEDFFRNGQ